MWLLTLRKVFPGGSGMVKNLPGMWETTVRSLGWKDPLGKKMATHSSILTWRITWTEEPGRLQSVGSQELDKTHQLIHSFHYLTLSKATSQGNSQTQLWVTSHIWQMEEEAPQPCLKGNLIGEPQYPLQLSYYFTLLIYLRVEIANHNNVSILAEIIY